MILAAGLNGPVCADVWTPVDKRDSAAEKSTTAETGTEVKADAGVKSKKPVSDLEVTTEVSPGTITPDAGIDIKAKVPDLELTPGAAHAEMYRETVTTSSVGKVMAFGLSRGFANVVFSPVELVRGSTFEFTIRKWYFAFATMLPAGIGGTLSRISAGAADLFTLGMFGDQELAEGYPDFVWQEDWSYHPDAPRVSTIVSPSLVPLKVPEVDISSEDKRSRQTRKTAEQAKSQAKE
jgi:hypothetical protein